MSTSAKYAGAAERWSEEQYADSVAYLRHRAELIVSLGLPLEPGDRILDLACGDAGLADFLRGYDYLGVDASEEMVRAARDRGAHVELADLNAYEPPEPVAATTCFRAIYYARDRRELFRRVAGYTTKKLVFDFDPRAVPAEPLLADVRAAGWERVEVRPFLMPQRHRLPRPLQTLLFTLEPVPGARLLTTVRFPLLLAAS